MPEHRLDTGTTGKLFRRLKRKECGSSSENQMKRKCETIDDPDKKTGIIKISSNCLFAFLC
ncbi:hypothetical protein K788_0007873 (plasmid) [Paraburkholderia caribensis MBA4]|uniref:Uncharacterized protein n=1 Tax=Paraburkholderia caribensis MBA4 TaxID=1323664 RepID=A0A0P0RLC4_9BURK|nr:hypothetical protein K788_0007873 [Paraburkholderia caribensis MBA4]